MTDRSGMSREEQNQAIMERIGIVGLVMGSVSGLCTTILIVIAKTGNLESMPHALGILLGGGATTLLFVVFLQLLACLIRKSRQVRLVGLGFLLALLPLLYVILESTGNLPGGPAG